MADTPAAEFEVDSALAARLLAEQMPDLAALPLAPVSAGWDNVMFRLGDDLAVRVPRRAMAAQPIVNEQRWLGSIARRVDVAIPAPVRCGRPSAYYPWHWSVVPWFDGVAAGLVSIESRRSIAETLARFIAQVHTPAPRDAPRNAVRGGTLAGRNGPLMERLASGLVPHAGDMAAVWQDALDAAPWDRPAVWLHGDLHPFNIVLGGDEASVGETSRAMAGAENIDRAYEVRAIIDFGDMTAGDPACDLATAWLTFDAPGRTLFRERVTAACGTDEATWRRARGWALVMATSLCVFSDDNPPFAALGARTLDEIRGEF